MSRKFVIQKRHGLKRGTKGNKIIILDGEGKYGGCVTVHGFTAGEVKDKIYFTFFEETYHESEKVRRDALQWKVNHRDPCPPKRRN